MTIQFLYQLVNVCKSYFGDFDENHIRKQFVLIYELLDEVILIINLSLLPRILKLKKAIINSHFDINFGASLNSIKNNNFNIF